MRHQPASGRRHRHGVQLAVHAFCDCIFLTNRPTAAPRAIDPKSKANGLRALPPWTQNGDPIPQPEVWTRRLKLHSIGLKRVAATQGNGLRANCRCPALATVLATEVHQGRTTRNMLQGRCQPPHFQKDGLKSLQVRGENDCTHALPNETHAGASRRLDICAQRRARRAEHVRPGLGFTREPAINCYPNPLNLGSCSCPNRPTSC